VPAGSTRSDDDLTFSVKPRLLTLLGDQLIRDANLAVFELVKNAYDADATECSVALEYPDEAARARIIVEDNGCGMNEETLRNVWMVIATDFRYLQRENNLRSKKFNRYPLGEKGLGRLSIHKLGRVIKLVTRASTGKELVMQIDWDRIEAAPNLETAFIRLERRKPEIFAGHRHGTRIEVTRLREIWTRGEVRRLHRAVNSLCSPFKGPTDFEVSLAIKGQEEWLKGMFTADDANSAAVYHVKGTFKGTTASFNYTFSPPEAYSEKINGRKEEVSGLKLGKQVGRKTVPIDLGLHKIGSVEFEFRMFDRDAAVLRAITGDVKGLKDYLDENGGIRVYRDGIRVYDFGEPGNDWLNLDIRRVNTPTARTSNNQILGALRLDATNSGDLREKTNREGFIENPAFADFRDAVISVLTQIEAEKGKDQRKLREAIGKGTGKRVFEKLSEIREVLKNKGVLTECEPMLKAAEKEMEMYRDQLLHAAVPGLTIGMMLHGAEKILDELRAATRKNVGSARIRELVERLYRSMRPVTNLLKDPNPRKTSASVLIKEAIFSAELRLRRHQIQLVHAEVDNNPDFTVQGSKQMLVASVTNLIDNSIHWLESKNPSPKLVYIGATKDLEGGPAIIVADNGPGFGKDDPDDLVAPFFTRRLGGMGLGLYIVSEVMRVNGGQLVFPNDGDVGLPAGLTGAVVAMQFIDKK